MENIFNGTVVVATATGASVNGCHSRTVHAVASIARTDATTIAGAAVIGGATTGSGIHQAQIPATLIITLPPTMAATNVRFNRRATWLVAGLDILLIGVMALHDLNGWRITTELYPPGSTATIPSGDHQSLPLIGTSNQAHPSGALGILGFIHDSAFALTKGFIKSSALAQVIDR